MTYQTRSWSAFREADLIANSNNPHQENLGHGDSFVMPGAATTQLGAQDHDGRLSGDRGDDATDHSQEAFVNGHAIHGEDIYIEQIWILRDAQGKTYKLAEIEIEDYNAAGRGDDFFSFVGEVPPAGAKLTFESCYNVTGHGISYDLLSADPVPSGPTWEFDDVTCSYTVQAEDFDLHNFQIVHGAHAAGGELVKISGHDGKLSTHFGGTDGVYNLTVCVQDETDGASMLKVFVNGELQDTIVLNRDRDGGGSNDGGFSEFTLNGLEIAEGDTVELRAWKDNCEFVRIDEVKFEQVKFEECDTPGAVKLDFEGFAAGAVLTDQLDGITISAMGGSGDAMIFDSQNPTGGDGDLETQVAQLGNVLIVSEDGDSSDPDDAIGGKITFEFDNPSSVFDLKFIDTEEGGTVTLTLADGSTQTFDVPELVNGGVGQLVVDVANVVRMDVQLDGSGAIDDLCYVPGQPPLGSLSGRYFCDDNRDGLDNDGADNGVEGVTVELLDAAGNGTGITTSTDASGNYAFAGLIAGTYGVKFTDTVSGKVVTTQNVDGNLSDDIDSDAADLGDGMSSIGGIVVVAGQDTPDNDAGVVEQLGSLSGRYFCDDNRDGLDNDGAGNGVEGVTVELLDAAGNGTGITTSTDASGNYAFAGLVAGTYGVKLTDTVSGKVLTTQNVDGNVSDDIDSDAVDLGDGMSSIGGIVVVAGQDTPDNDAGVFAPNEDPDVTDDMGKGCAPETITVDFSDNFSDPDSASVGITMIGGLAITAGQTVTIGGVDVTLTLDDEFIFDGSTAYENLGVGEEATQSFEVKVEDSDGAAVTATIDVTFCGAYETFEELEASLPLGDEVCFQIIDGGLGTISSDSFTLLLTDADGDARLDNVVFTEAYCVGAFEDIVRGENGTDITAAPKLTGTISLLDDDSVLGSAPDSVTLADTNADIDETELDNMINYILNQDYADQGYTDSEVQGAIWGITDDIVFVQAGTGQQSRAQEILDDAIANGQDFMVGEGDTVGLYIDPTADSDAAGHTQPFVVGILWDECIC
ncbi:SdrD B-like domain-containing protein [uncultured Roseobacter sp.]|uniref:SdrD B-like domain-containing protein n=1 Tax=uncultured Roseobacter sp. TaxID=114847 RepID=UPI00263039D7|nr:SdrD B-like domain-containing protein [uncultured Roseobacter sp.]